MLFFFSNYKQLWCKQIDCRFREMSQVSGEDKPPQQKDVVHRKFLNQQKRDQDFLDSEPCQIEATLSTKCMKENSYDNSQCQRYFDNYNACKKFWLRVRQDRARKKIFPHLPPASERDAIKAEYKAKFKM